MTPSDRAYARNESHPIGGKDEDEDSGKIPEGALSQMRPNDPDHELVESLNQPFQEILRASGHLLHLSRRDLRKQKETQCNDQTDNHRVGDREVERTSDLYCLGRQAVFLGLQWFGRRVRLRYKVCLGCRW